MTNRRWVVWHWITYGLAVALLVGSCCARRMAMAYPSEPTGTHTTMGVGFVLFRMVEFAPSIHHINVYMETARCVGVHRNPTGTKWILAESIFNRNKGTFPVGLWIKEPRAIVLVYSHAWDATVISHEAIHDLTELPDPLPEEMRQRCEIGYK